MNLDYLKIFVAIAKQGSILAASKALDIPKSTVARHLDQLEKQLSHQLVLRNTRHLRLTAEGQRLYHLAGDIIGELEEVEHEMKGRHGDLSGRITVAIPSEFGVKWLNESIADFVADHPDIAIDCITSMAPLDPVRRDVDVSICYHRGKLSDSGMVVRPLVSMRSAVVAAPSVVADHGRPASVQELSHLPCISTLTALQANPWHFIDVEGRTIALDVPTRYRVDSSLMLIAGARAGIGFAIIPYEFCKESIAAGDLVEFALDLQPAPLEIVAIHPNRQSISTRTRAFVDIVEQQLRARQDL
ncbi:LysR family transcriptional regulator [Chromohalobacter canadensis]|uniref:LysR family transcriptional regulator n=1 Tax=Chromohalobacter canadensis TaxID=141389 RepID=UPI0021C15776|nr:LysR family transcriptional regulator [Chromohalobacter canadensis]MCT8467251.1 LysR family transcriptional regulator [Chromohalobacter canadensis]MCT8471001.1 LysR family transcriptional regulator [Chromohalobacter canadensis]MCT8497748.1 LysR family transcriptional regulator [Chromohalobacter canadensis]